MKAWRVVIENIEGFAYGEKRSEAKWKAISSWREVHDFGEKDWPHYTWIIREPRYDHLDVDTSRCYNRIYLENKRGGPLKWTFDPECTYYNSFYGD